MLEVDRVFALVLSFGRHIVAAEHLGDDAPGGHAVASQKSGQLALRNLELP